MDDALVNKRFFKPEHKAAVLNAPPGYLERLGIPVIGDLSNKSSLDFIQAFVTDKTALLPLAPNMIRALKPDGLLWLCYPKGGSKVKTDLNRDILWAEMGKFGLAGVAMVSIDDTWSAMRFRPKR
jgi:hypothetical protein